MGVTIIQSCFQDVIADLEYDTIITDPPYGVGYEYDGYEDTVENLDAIIATLAPHLTRAMVFSGVGNMHRWPQPKWTMAWVEPAGAGSGPYGFTCWQPILAYGADIKLQDGQGRHPDTFIGRGGSASSDRHPVAKPISVMRWIIERTTRPGETILDPFAGSGTTAVAALEAGRNIICVEQSAAYCEVISQRTSQLTLGVH